MSSFSVHLYKIFHCSNRPKCTLSHSNETKAHYKHRPMGYKACQATREVHDKGPMFTSKPHSFFRSEYSFFFFVSARNKKIQGAHHLLSFS